MTKKKDKETIRQNTWRSMRSKLGLFLNRLNILPISDIWDFSAPGFRRSEGVFGEKAASNNIL
jgi:hypothetical protein